MTTNKRITYSDIQKYLVIGDNMAKKILKDIKFEYDIKIVTMEHLKKYLKV